MSQPSAEVQFNVAAQSAVAQMQMFSNMFKKQIQEMRNEVKKFNEAKDTKTPFSEWATDVGKFTLSLVGANSILAATQKAFQLIASEIRNAKEVAEYAGSRQIPYQQQLKGISAMLDDPADLNRIDSIIKNANVPDKSMLASMVRLSLSAGDTLTDMEKATLTARVAEQRADMMDSDPFTLKQYATQAIIGYQQFKKDAPNMTVDQFTDSQLMLMEKGRKLSTVDDPKLYADNVASTINKLSMWGLNQAQATALTVATTNAVMDTTGEVTGTGLQNLLPKIKQFLTSQGIEAPTEWDALRKWMRGDSEGAGQLREYMGGALLSDLTPEEIAGLTDAKRGKLAVDHIPGRGKAVYQMMQLFARQGEADDPLSVNARIDSITNSIGFVKNADGSVNAEASYQKMADEQAKWKAGIDSNPMFNTSNIDYGMRSSTEKMAIENGGLRSLFTQADDVLKQGGRGANRRWIDSTYDDWFGSTDDASVGSRYANRLLGQSRENVLRELTAKGYGSNKSYEIGQEVFADNRISKEEQAKYGFSDKTATAVNAMMALMERIVAALEQPPPVEIKNQPPAQPKKPAAEGLKTQ